MHLPGPIRAAVGLVATAADEVKSLPDRAVELPMLAVSTALQVSLRAQQRYAQLAARGEQLLNREQPGEDPPAWATFDEPVPADDLRRSALNQLDSLIDGDAPGESSGDVSRDVPSTGQSVGRMFEQLFGVSDPTAGIDGPAATDPDGDAGADGADGADDADRELDRVVVPITQAPTVANGRSPRKSARKTSRKTPVKKVPAAKKAVSEKTPEKTAPVKKAAAKKAPAAKKTATDAPAGKSISKPRHTTPSKFDDAGD